MYKLSTFSILIEGVVWYNIVSLPEPSLEIGLLIALCALSLAQLYSPLGWIYLPIVEANASNSRYLFLLSIFQLSKIDCSVIVDGLDDTVKAFIWNGIDNAVSQTTAVSYPAQ